MPSLNLSSLSGQKNLLAFSAGIDSSALFFLLIDSGISFDIAIVNYGLRESSDIEEQYAQTLAKEYNLICYSTKAPIFESNFEKNARDFRYRFFVNIIKENSYNNLITAHQLNDQLEWLLMRLTKGAGLSELLGLQEISQREDYTLVRPLLEYSKEELLEYLHTSNHKYYIDESNTDPKYERNRFREEFANTLMQNYSKGIKRSFDYLRADKRELEANFETLQNIKQLYIIKLHTLKAKTKATDLILKKEGYLLSSAQRREIETKESLVIGGIWAIETKEELLYISPYRKSSMPKRVKELYRVAKIPHKIRSYCFEEGVLPLDLDK